MGMPQIFSFFFGRQLLSFVLLFLLFMSLIRIEGSSVQATYLPYLDIHIGVTCSI